MIPVYSKLLPFLRKNSLAVKPLREMVQSSEPFVIVHMMDIQGSGLREKVYHSIWIGHNIGTGTGLVQKVYDSNKARIVSDLLKEMVEKGFLEVHQIDDLTQEYALPSEWEGDRLNIFPFFREEISNWLKHLEREKPRGGIFKFRKGGR